MHLPRWAEISGTNSILFVSFKTCVYLFHVYVMYMYNVYVYVRVCSALLK